MQRNQKTRQGRGSNGALNRHRGFATSKNQDLNRLILHRRAVGTRAAKVRKEKPHHKTLGLPLQVFCLKIVRVRSPLSHPSAGDRLLRSNLQSIQRQIKKRDLASSSFGHSVVCFLPGWSRNNCTNNHHRGVRVPPRHHQTAVHPHLKLSQGSLRPVNTLGEVQFVRSKGIRRVRRRGDQ